jgi:PAS domain S-box-containing protein
MSCESTDGTLLLKRYRELQNYVGWHDAQSQQVIVAGQVLRPHIDELIDDFYAQIQRHSPTRELITGGAAQVERLKQTLREWLAQLLAGRYDEQYVQRRWRVGRKHVEIGLDQIYTTAALARLRGGMLRWLHAEWKGGAGDLALAAAALHRVLDLDLAMIADAYQFEHLRRQEQLERRRLAEAKSRSEESFRNLVEEAGCVIVILRPDSTVAYVNPFAEELTGYAADEVVGRDFFMLLLPASQRHSVLEGFEQALNGNRVRNRQNILLKKDGSEAVLLWNARRLDDFQGSPAVLAVGNDLTAVKEAQSRALQSERLAAIGQMVAGLAHESRNALQRCQACLEMLELEIGDNAAAQDLIQRIQRAQDQLHRLFEEVRSYAGPIKLELSSCPLPEVWREAWESLSAQRTGRTASLRESLTGKNLQCRIDRFRMVQVFRNLLENSLAACKDPVEIEVACSSAQRGDDSAVQIAFRDNGPGLTAEQRRRIFEPFFTTKTQGTGLGMAIALRIVDAHGGRMVVGSDRWPGAEILLTIPCRPATLGGTEE